MADVGVTLTGQETSLFRAQQLIEMLQTLPAEPAI